MTAEAPVETELKVIEPTALNNKSIDLPSTGDPIMDLVQQAVLSNNLDMVERLFSIRDKEEARNAKAEFNIAYTKMQHELPVIPKRGRGHNNAQFALFEDIVKYSKPVLSKYGLSLRHNASNPESTVIVSAILAHIGGHSEVSTMQASPDASGGKNSIQAIKSTNSYLKRITSENILGIASHGEDDDAFAAGDTDELSKYRMIIGKAKGTEELNQIRAKLMADTSITGPDRTKAGHVWTAANKAAEALEAKEKANA